MTTANLTQPSGNYFEKGTREGEVAFAKLLPEEERTGLEKVLIRSWTLGEIISAIAASGLVIRALEEIPGPTDARFPEFYTLVADHMGLELSAVYP